MLFCDFTLFLSNICNLYFIIKWLKETANTTVVLKSNWITLVLYIFGHLSHSSDILPLSKLFCRMWPGHIDTESIFIYSVLIFVDRTHVPKTGLSPFFDWLLFLWLAHLFTIVILFLFSLFLIFTFFPVYAEYRLSWNIEIHDDVMRCVYAVLYNTYYRKSHFEIPLWTSPNENLITPFPKTR